MNYDSYQIQFISRNFGCRDFHPHCKEILKLNSSACDGDFRSSQFMRIACMETCKKCGEKVRLLSCGQPKHSILFTRFVRYFMYATCATCPYI